MVLHAELRARGLKQSKRQFTHQDGRLARDQGASDKEYKRYKHIQLLQTALVHQPKTMYQAAGSHLKEHDLCLKSYPLELLPELLSNNGPSIQTLPVNKTASSAASRLPQDRAADQAKARLAKPTLHAHTMCTSHHEQKVVLSTHTGTHIQYTWTNTTQHAVDVSLTQSVAARQVPASSGCCQDWSGCLLPDRRCKAQRRVQVQQ